MTIKIKKLSDNIKRQRVRSSAFVALQRSMLLRRTSTGMTKKRTKFNRESIIAAVSAVFR